MPSYVTSDGTPFTTSWTQDAVINWWTSRGVSADVAMQEATTDLLRYGDDLPRVMQSMLPHLLERSNTFLKSGAGSESTQPNQAQPSASNGGSFAPAPMASIVTSMGAAQPASATPTVGPVGLAYPDDPVNYATGEVSAANGYSTGGILPSGIYPGSPDPMAPMGANDQMGSAPEGSNIMLYVILAAVAVGGYLLLSK
jgi:hypothetical protein